MYDRAGGIIGPQVPANNLLCFVHDKIRLVR